MSRFKPLLMNRKLLVDKTVSDIKYFSKEENPLWLKIIFEILFAFIIIRF